MMASEHTVLFSADVVSGAVRDLAASIDRDLAGSRLVVITVLKGAVMFSCELMRAMETETEQEFLSASSYSGGFTPDETLHLRQDIELDVAGRDVLIVDDIIDTNNRVEWDHGRLKARLRPMRGLRTDRTASTVIRGHAFMQNLRRGHYELGVEARHERLRVAAAFDELAAAV